MKTANQWVLTIVTAMILALASANADARTADIRDIDNMPVPAGLKLEDISASIVAGAANRGWTALEVGPGHIEATLYIRSHMAKVDIKFDTKTYNITYADSDNLKFDAVKYKIHKNYNSWVQNMNSDIRAELARAQRMANR